MQVVTEAGCLLTKMLFTRFFQQQLWIELIDAVLSTSSPSCALFVGIYHTLQHPFNPNTLQQLGCTHMQLFSSCDECNISLTRERQS